MFRLLLAAFLWALPWAARAQTAMSIPRMAPAEALQLFDAAGFKFVDRHIENRCGHIVNPRIAFVDLNGDGRPEAHVADVDPACYGKPGAYYAVLMRNDAGRWGQMIAEDAILSFDTTRTAGWLDIEVKPGNGACPGMRHYRSYGYTVPCTAGAAVATPPAAVAAAPRGGYPTDGWKLPVTFAALPPSDQDAIMRAAGLIRAGPVWRGCEGSSQADAKSVEIKDLNHDGRPEAIVSDAGYECYGNSGQEFTILRATPGGWVQMMQVTGIIDRFMKSTGVGGYPDLMAGGPGTCVGIWRSDGRTYKILRRQEGNGDNGAPCHF